MRARFAVVLFTALVCFGAISCGRDNSVSPAGSTRSGKLAASGLAGSGNATGANTGIQGKTATGAGAGALGGVRGNSSNTGTNEDARNSQKAHASSGASQRP